MDHPTQETYRANASDAAVEAMGGAIKHIRSEQAKSARMLRWVFAFVVAATVLQPFTIKVIRDYMASKEGGVRAEPAPPPPAPPCIEHEAKVVKVDEEKYRSCTHPLHRLGFEAGGQQSFLLCRCRETPPASLPVGSALVPSNAP